MNADFYAIKHPERVCTPALIYYEDVIRQNTRNAIEVAGGADRLWPHVKSHKMAEMIRMQLEMGIRRFKCATIPELRMVAEAGAAHAVYAYPLVGPAISLFLDAIVRYPATAFYAIGDSIEAVSMLSREADARGMAVSLLIDVNLGMNRTGVDLVRLRDFARACAALPGIRPVGFHCYDGHIHDADPEARYETAHAPMEGIFALRDELGLSIIIAGGSPTFPCHAREEGVFLSPGTVFLWDFGSMNHYPDLPFVPGAAVLARVVSHPADGRFTIDVGNKAIAADPTGVRGGIAGFEEMTEPVLHSEEHWVFQMKPGFEGKRPAIGAVLCVIPTHVCPTSALYARAIVVSGGEIKGEWTVTARDRITLLPE